ncbi:MAG TPA: hypothetical protein VEY93_16195 [Longimicrobium sp.]|nr:hypothetical protein [Longimicrobium sp.]
MHIYDRLHAAMGLQEIRALPGVHFIENNYTNLSDYCTLVMTTLADVGYGRASE